MFGKPDNDQLQALSMTSPVIMEKNNGTSSKSSNSEKISMTAPVVNSDSGKMSFIMPSKYKTLSDLPKPNDARIQLREVPSMVSAAPYAQSHAQILHAR